MHSPDPTSRLFGPLLHSIESGSLKIPQFQRAFVWTRSMSAGLIDSVVKGFPIGTFIVWRTREHLRSLRELGNVKLPAVPDGDYAEQVLDGQQRLTSLFATARGLKVKRDDGREEDFSRIWVDLDAAPHGEAPVVTAAEPDSVVRIGQDGRWVRFVDVLSGNFDLLASLSKARRDRCQQIASSIQTYAFSLIIIKDAPLDVATEIFTRINVGGQTLTVFDVMVAKTWDGPSGFDLAQRWRSLEARLANIEYETVPSSAALFLAALLVKGECAKKDILGMPSSSFREVWKQVEDGIEHACDWLKQRAGIPASRLLPYGILVVPVAYFFVRSKGAPPTVAQLKYLLELLFRSAISGRFSSAVESKLALDVKRIDALLAGKALPLAEPAPLSPEIVRARGLFRTSSAFIKAILCVMARRGPRSFEDNGKVALDNDWLKRSNSKNYHHFFPKSKLKKRGVPREKYHHVANITIVDDYLNKKVIGARDPKDYLGQFRKTNPSLKETLSTHLIDPDDFGVWENDYDLFLTKRCESIYEELRKLVPHRPEIDQRSGADSLDDADPEQSVEGNEDQDEGDADDES